MTDKRGHVPVLVDKFRKVERCKVCGQLRRRVERWAMRCPGQVVNKEAEEYHAATERPSV